MWKYVFAALSGCLMSLPLLAAEPGTADLELTVYSGTATLDPNVSAPLRVTDDSDNMVQASAGTSDVGAWAFQFRYARFGEAEVSNVASVKYKAVAAAVRYTHALTSGISVSALAGPALVTADSRLLSLESTTDTRAFLGGSLNMALGDRWMLRLEGNRYGSDANGVVLGLGVSL